MLFRFVCFLLMLLVAPAFVCGPAYASGGGKPKADAHGGGGGDKKKEDAASEGGVNDVASIFGGDNGEPVYVRMKPVVLPVISDKGAEQLVNIIIDLEAKDFDTATHLSSNKPKLNDAIIRALYGGLADGSMRNAHSLDIVKIKANIRNTINQTFGEGTILEVLVQAVEQRKF